MSLLSVFTPASALRALALGAAAVLLAACGDDATETPDTTVPAAVTTAQPPAAPVAAEPAPAVVPAETPAELANVTHALLFGDWAPDAATCGNGVVMTVAAASVGGAAMGVAQCAILSSSRAGDELTVVANCSAPETNFREVTLTLRATVVGEAAPATMTVLQEGAGMAVDAMQPIDVIRCAAP
ncbi:MAG: hypothetical protein ACWA6X_09410 [Bauldia sp.]